ncbi:MAG: hypothetical protein RL885_04105 [Planctomycetota bacterium]
MNLDERIDRLEAANRRLRSLLVLSLLVAVGSLCLPAFVGSTAEVIEAERFVVRDKTTGRVLAELGIFADRSVKGRPIIPGHTAGLQVYDHQGQAEGSLACFYGVHLDGGEWGKEGVPHWSEPMSILFDRRLENYVMIGKGSVSCVSSEGTRSVLSDSGLSLYGAAKSRVSLSRGDDGRAILRSTGELGDLIGELK